MNQTVHCRDCKGVGRVSQGYDGAPSVVCLSCRGAGIIDVTQEQLDEWAREEMRLQERIRASSEEAQRQSRRWDRWFILAVVGFFALVGALLGNILIGAGIGLIVVVVLWFAGD